MQNLERKSAKEPKRITPMIRQYMAMKEEVPDDAILMFRMGDFFELFFDDAILAAQELGLTLTSRDKDRGEDSIPMAGVPFRAVEPYVAKLVQRGYCVAMCDQIENPKYAKGIVKRAVTQVITPGTMNDLESLDPCAAHYLAYVKTAEYDENILHIGLLDLLAGELRYTQCLASNLIDELLRVGAKEVLFEPDDDVQYAEKLQHRHLHLRRLDKPASLDKDKLARFFTERFKDKNIAGLLRETKDEERSVIYRLVEFAEGTQRRRLEHLMPPQAYIIEDFLVLDEVSRRNLELSRTIYDNERKGSLVWHLDRCKTAIGSRTIHHWLLFPLRSMDEIKRRQKIIAYFVKNRPLRQKTQRLFVVIRDLERLLGRVAVGRATPRDICALRDSLQVLPEIQKLMAEHDFALGHAWVQADVLASLTKTLGDALIDEAPLSRCDGGIFRLGFRTDLDELIQLSTDSHAYLQRLEEKERKQTGISNLKIRYNKVFGYYIEVSKGRLDNVPEHYVRKQTLVNAERFITEELKVFETKMLNVEQERKALEQEVFEEVLTQVSSCTSQVRALTRLIGMSDALLSLGQVADEYRYVCPDVVEAPVLELEEARHPVIERLMAQDESFVPNSIKLSADKRQLLIVTGPNMAGKSTVLRQVALASIMAQMGSFVPAKKATIGLVDRVFTRVGASDNIGQGQSTFMVEMTETATILNHATPKSLVLLDEVGRGTSTYDGVSLAWAVAEFIHDKIGARTMFATHYHELTDLAERKERIVNTSVAVKDDGEKVVFLRTFKDGATDRSYGIHVAELAGLPKEVTQQAEGLLANLEEEKNNLRGLAAQPLAPTVKQNAPEVDVLQQKIADLNLNAMTPLDALNFLSNLQKEID
ncbi:MAG: DNA mismatch repair protein MutS [Myxococcota bacterium]|nr:DNA mismatch repair protein MutS [Myxococcota bacterium]